MQDQGFSFPSQNAADWDTDLNANFVLLQRGYVVPRIVGATAINTGFLVTLNSSGLAVAYDGRSFGLGEPFGIATQVGSPGNEADFVVWGAVSSVVTWSGQITLGAPVYASPYTPGLVVGPYTGAMVEAGRALHVNGVMFRPRMRETQVYTTVNCGFAFPTTTFSFAVDVGRRGIVRDLRVQAASVNNFQVTFYANSGRTDIAYQTRITSGQIAVNTIFLRDAALWPYEATDTASPFTIYGAVDVISSSVLTVVSGAFSVRAAWSQER